MFNRLTKLLHLAQSYAPCLLVVYLTVLLIATHIPEELPMQAGPLEVDKLVHLIAYGLLGLLLTMAIFRRSTTLGAFAFAVVVGLVMAIGLVDELTQPWFNRACDPYDWIADVLGAAVGFTAFVLARRSGALPPVETVAHAAGAQ